MGRSLRACGHGQWAGVYGQWAGGKGEWAVGIVERAWATDLGMHHRHAM